MSATISGEYRITSWLKVGTTNQLEKYGVHTVSSNNDYGSLLTAILMLDPLTPTIRTKPQLRQQHNADMAVTRAIAAGHS